MKSGEQGRGAATGPLLTGCAQDRLLNGGMVTQLEVIVGGKIQPTFPVQPGLAKPVILPEPIQLFI